MLRNGQLLEEILFLSTWLDTGFLLTTTIYINIKFV